MRTHAFGTPSWVDLQTPDPECARAFYAGLLGWTYDIGGLESGFYAMAQKDGRAAAGIGEMPPGAASPSAWTLYFNVASADDAVAAVQANGGSVLMPAMTVMDAGRMAICTDPTGAVFGLWQPRKHTGADAWEEPGAATWMEVNTRDSVRARDFYTSVFGLTWQPIQGMNYYTLHHGDKAHAGVLQMTEMWPAELPPHWMVYFGVPDTDAAAARVRELGGTVHVAPFDTPYGRIAVVADPLGAVFTVVATPTP